VAAGQGIGMASATSEHAPTLLSGHDGVHSPQPVSEPDFLVTQELPLPLALADGEALLTTSAEGPTRVAGRKPHHTTVEPRYAAIGAASATSACAGASGQLGAATLVAGVHTSQRPEFSSALLALPATVYHVRMDNGNKPLAYMLMALCDASPNVLQRNLVVPRVQLGSAAALRPEVARMVRRPAASSGDEPSSSVCAPALSQGEIMALGLGIKSFWPSMRTGGGVWQSILAAVKVGAAEWWGNHAADYLLALHPARTAAELKAAGAQLFAQLLQARQVDGGPASRCSRRAACMTLAWLGLSVQAAAMVAWGEGSVHWEAWAIDSADIGELSYKTAGTTATTDAAAAAARTSNPEVRGVTVAPRPLKAAYSAGLGPGRQHTRPAAADRAIVPATCTQRALPADAVLRADAQPADEVPVGDEDLCGRAVAAAVEALRLECSEPGPRTTLSYLEFARAFRAAASAGALGHAELMAALPTRVVLRQPAAKKARKD
jgi:hypothetical protein